MRILVTGSAGFIGFHTARRLLAEGHEVFGLDGMTPYYDVALKRQRTALLAEQPRFTGLDGMLEDGSVAADAVARAHPEVVIHLAAQAGVRYSIENPRAYIDSNLVGTYALLEALRAAPPAHLLLASTSSVYGGNTRMPFRETDLADFPMSLYAATKKATESVSHAYAHLFGIPTTCFRFFTVYGPWGRPDMALFKFTDAIGRGVPIEVYGEGRMQRDFTYIDDVVEGICRLLTVVPAAGVRTEVPGGEDSVSPVAPWRVVNIAGGVPFGLLPFIEAIEAALGRSATRTMLPMQPGDVARTEADPALLRALTGYVPATPVAEGVRAFVAWFTRWKSESLPRVRD